MHMHQELQRLSDERVIARFQILRLLSQVRRYATRVSKVTTVRKSKQSGSPHSTFARFCWSTRTAFHFLLPVLIVHLML